MELSGNSAWLLLALGRLDAVGVAIRAIASGGEALADRQPARLRAQPGSRGRFCREGLWLHGCHPNHFFEWLHRWACVASRGDSDRACQRTTNTLFPGSPRPDPEASQ